MFFSLSGDKFSFVNDIIQLPDHGTLHEFEYRIGVKFLRFNVTDAEIYQIFQEISNFNPVSINKLSTHFNNSTPQLKCTKKIDFGLLDQSRYHCRIHTLIRTNQSV